MRIHALATILLLSCLGWSVEVLAQTRPECRADTQACVTACLSRGNTKGCDA
jgi:hypothetical protein